MPRAAVLPIVLIVAGLTTVVFSTLAWSEGPLVIFGTAAGLLGPLGLDYAWLERLPNIVGGLGVAAALCGVLELRWSQRWVAALVALALALGAAFVIAWLVDPPESLYMVIGGGAVHAEGGTGKPFALGWPAYAAAATLAIGAVAAAGLARRRA